MNKPFIIGMVSKRPGGKRRYIKWGKKKQRWANGQMSTVIRSCLSRDSMVPRGSHRAVVLEEYSGQRKQAQKTSGL